MEVNREVRIDVDTASPDELIQWSKALSELAWLKSASKYLGADHVSEWTKENMRLIRRSRGEERER